MVRPSDAKKSGRKVSGRMAKPASSEEMWVLSRAVGLLAAPPPSSLAVANLSQAGLAPQAPGATSTARMRPRVRVWRIRVAELVQVKEEAPLAPGQLQGNWATPLPGRTLPSPTASK